jgi:starch synthase (maltosyl-transferring)
VFLAEAFTRRSVMRHLAKIGFSQSYTYFTWKNSRWELSEYVSELAYSGEQEYFRPNFFANTPDILHAYLQQGGRPAFEARLILAATLSPSYGIYSGYEAIENVAVKEGSEEYLHSEKYEIKKRKLKGELLPLIKQINFIRRDNPALQHFSNVTFLDTANDALIGYAKQAAGNTVVTVVNVDPHQGQEGVATIPASLNLPPSFTARDLLTDERYQWRIGPNYVRLEPGLRQAHLIRVES